jgi:hypothetical protein
LRTDKESWKCCREAVIETAKEIIQQVERKENRGWYDKGKKEITMKKLLGDMGMIHRHKRNSGEILN